MPTTVKAFLPRLVKLWWPVPVPSSNYFHFRHGLCCKSSMLCQNIYEHLTELEHLCLSLRYTAMQEKISLTWFAVPLVLVKEFWWHNPRCPARTSIIKELSDEKPPPHASTFWDERLLERKEQKTLGRSIHKTNWSFEDFAMHIFLWYPYNTSWSKTNIPLALLFQQSSLNLSGRGAGPYSLSTFCQWSQKNLNSTEGIRWVAGKAIFL